MKSIWIARDKNGILWATVNKPVRHKVVDMWEVEDGIPSDYSRLQEDWFPQLTWQDEPIELVTKEKED